MAIHPSPKSNLKSEIYFDPYIIKHLNLMITKTFLLSKINDIPKILGVVYNTAAPRNILLNLINNNVPIQLRL
jgi:hypothetical protein